MKNKLLLFTILPTFLSAVTITDVVQNAIYTTPSVHVEKEALNAEVQRLGEVKSAYLPSFDLSFSIGPETTKAPSNSGKKVSLVRKEASATITQNIFSGFKTINSSSQQKSLILSAQSNVEDVANSLALDTASAYVEVLKTSKLYEIAKDNVLVHAKYLLQIKEKLDAGLAINSDYVQTLSRFENAKSAEFLAKQNYLVATYTLQRLSPDVNVTSLEEPILSKLPATTVEGLVKLAMENNTNLNILNSDINAAKSAVDVAKSEYYPKVDVVLNAYKNDRVHGLGAQVSVNQNPITEDSGYNGLVVVNYNLFNGLASSARSEVSKSILLKKKATLEDAKLFIKANIKTSFTTNELTKKRLIHMKKNIQASKEAVSDYVNEYDLGRRTILDLLNIELEYNNARNLQITAKYDLIKSHYQLLSYTGYLLKDMSIVVK